MAEKGVVSLGAGTVEQYIVPTIAGWNRLEPRSRRGDFDRALRAEIRDPLWMLTRQWQLGEFEGEDAGSAVKAQLLLETTRINRYRARGGTARAYDDALPLETRVEREAVAGSLTMRIRAGRHWIKLLAGSPATGDYRAAYLLRYPISEPGDAASQEHLYSDPEALQLLRAVQGRVVDGASLLDDIRAGGHASWVATHVSPADVAALLEVAEQFLAWFRRIFNQPADPDDSAWAPSYLEYQFRCSAPGEAGDQTVLVAEQYHHGHLDWYSFELDGAPGASLDIPEGEAIVDAEPEQHLMSFIPAPMQYGGVPAARWWEMENRRIELADIDAGTTEIAKLLVAEFALIHGNDWSLIPFDLPVGTIADIKGIVVRDTFGRRTLVRPAGYGEENDWQRWSMYNLSPLEPASRPDHRLFLPPTIGTMLEGGPVEEVNLLRDEMSNMVWAVENVIPGPIGDGVPGDEAAMRLRELLVRQYGEPPPPELQETDAAIRYVLGTTVPENWIPFLPVHVPDSTREIQLQRAAMPRLLEGTSSPIVRPRGLMMRQGIAEGAPYFIHEEEVPRAGAVVSRSFQRTRWWNGAVVTWLGRRKRTGRGQGISGLRFDQIE